MHTDSELCNRLNGPKPFGYEFFMGLISAGESAYLRHNIIQSFTQNKGETTETRAGHGNAEISIKHQKLMG